MAEVSAVCRWCRKRMDVGAGCKVVAFDDFADKKVRERIPYTEGKDHCHDCNVRPGQFHHPGCDMERCPKCGGQAIGCDCTAGVE